MSDLIVSEYEVDCPNHRELLQWLRLNEIDPNDVPFDSKLLLAEHDGEWVIRYEVFLRNGNGLRYLVSGTDELAVQDVLTPLMFDPPAHWLVPRRV